MPVSRAGAEPTAFASTLALGESELREAPVRWPRPSRLRRPLDAPSKRTAAGLHALGVHTVGELLEHLPSDRREARTIATLTAGEPATVAVEVRAISARPVRRRGMRPLVEARVADASATMRARFFNQPWLVERYPPGTRLLLHGKADARGGFNVAHHALASAAAAESAADLAGASDLGAGPGPGGAATGPGGAASAPGGAAVGPGGATSAPGGAAGGAAAGPSVFAATEPVTGVAHYPATEGVSSTQILTLVQEHRDALRDVVEPLPAALRARVRLPDRPAALAAMHFPRAPGDPEGGRRRLAFEELLLGQLAFLRRRAARRARTGAAVLDERDGLAARWLACGLPFALTGDQRRAIEQIAADLAREAPMQRLLMGDVGSGKTVVALYAMLHAVGHGLQAALMAPTETLAEQHFATIQSLLGGGVDGVLVSTALLTGSTPARRRRDVLAKLSSGELSLVVGTHALIEPDVEFAALAVAVIDEQHRFGVRQRAALEGAVEAEAAAGGDTQTGGGGAQPGDAATTAGGRGRPAVPHTLHMTATPIPRTLALARYGDLDTSTLRELPHGRASVHTQLVSGAEQRAQAYERLRAELAAGRQAYVVCPLVEESEQAPEGVAAVVPGAAGPAQPAARAAKAELLRLREGELAGHELALLHGGMRPREKQEAMAAFASGHAQVLVATTVIEVGIDVPNATVMLIENAERFGLSQLHQLRGRVGRGEHDSCCFVVAGQPGAGAGRLDALVRHRDGFRLAEIDLAMRKQGELGGTRQSGVGYFRVASLPEDAQLLEMAHRHARELLRRDPELRAPEHALLAAALEGEATPIPA